MNNKNFPMFLYLEVNDLKKENVDLTRDEAKTFLKNKYGGTFSSELFDIVLDYTFKNEQEESISFKP